MNKMAHKSALGRLNRRFNRFESATDHSYLEDFGADGIGDQLYSGLIKCKLAHGLGRSIVIPDLIFLGKDGKKWIQPLAFGPPLLSKFSEHRVECRFSVDISCSKRLEVVFKSEEFVDAYADGSELYRCTIRGARSLQAHTTGDSELRRDKAPLITLYHHTTEDSKKNILAGKEFHLSSWNIQGTEKKIKNAGYVYFTALDQISCEGDLRCIAMSSDEVIYLTVDGFPRPTFLSQEILAEFAKNILPLQVYRGSTKDRTATIKLKIDVSVLTPQHLLLHTGDLPMWYEVCNPFTHRVGAQPKSVVGFSNETIDRGTFPAKTFQYIVVGDASLVDGLAAPFNEESTEWIFKIESPQPGRSILQLWFDLGNTDLFSSKDPELQDLEQAK